MKLTQLQFPIMVIALLYFVFITGTTLAMTTSGYGSAAVGTSNNSTVIPVEQVKTKILTAIEQKITALGLLPAKIEADIALTAEQKVNLIMRVDEIILLYNDLKDDVQAVQTSDDLKQVIQGYLTKQSGYKSRALTSAQSMQQMVSNLQLVGVDTAEVQEELDGLKSTLSLQQNTYILLGSGVVGAASVDQVVQGLRQWNQTAQSNQGTNTAAMNQWSQLQQKLQRVKTRYPSLFPTRTAPSVTVTRPIITRTPTRVIVPSINITRPAGVSCAPRPICLESSPPCLIPEPATGWCPVVR